MTMPEHAAAAEDQLWLFGEDHAPGDHASAPEQVAAAHSTPADHEADPAQMDMAAYPYFVLEGEEATGPFDPPEIQRKLAAGELNSGSYVWNQTLDEWLPLFRVFGLEPPDVEPEPDAQPTIDDYQDSLESTYALANFGPRFLGGAIDLLVVSGLFVATCVLVPPFRDWIEVNSAITENWLQVNLVLLVPVYLYFLLFLGPWGGGQTPGYRVCRLRLVDQQTRHSPSWLQSQLWCLGNVVNFIGWLFYWFDRQQRMLHNGISRTIVLQLPPS